MAHYREKDYDTEDFHKTKHDKIIKESKLFNDGYWKSRNRLQHGIQNDKRQLVVLTTASNTAIEVRRPFAI